MTDIDVAAETRLQFYADTLRVKAPAKLLADDGAPDKDLLRFCVRYGASLDWIFFGDVRGMIHDSYKAAKGERI